jgi:hypothetical protein
MGEIRSIYKAVETYTILLRKCERKICLRSISVDTETQDVRMWCLRSISADTETQDVRMWCLRSISVDTETGCENVVSPEHKCRYGDTGCENVGWINLKSFLGYNVVHSAEKSADILEIHMTTVSGSNSNPLVSCLVYSWVMKIEVTCSSKTSV